MKLRRIEGNLVARTAVHVGSGAGDDLVDAYLRRDAAGNLVIPGTALAGALRGMLTRLAPRLGAGTCLALLPEEERQAREKGCDCGVCRLMGDVEPADEGGGAATASRLWVYNAALETTSETAIRDGVGIDRATGAAAREVGAKFDLEVLPAGATFTLRIELQERDPEKQAAGEQLLAAVLAEWQAGRVYLGGDVARGLGAFDLKELKCLEIDLDDTNTLLQFLEDDTPWTNARDLSGWLPQTLQTVKIMDEAYALAQAVKTWGLNEESVGQLPISHSWVEWRFTLQATGPFLTHDTTAAGLSGFDHAPLLATIGDWTQPVLPGSSLRGVLRSQAERIARTLVTHQALGKPDPTGYFLKHCPACDPLTQRKPKNSDGLALESCDSLLRHTVGISENAEILPEELCLACQLFGTTRRGSRFFVEDAPFAGNDPVYKMLDFLAVDRFTGGGAEHLKFDALVLWQPAFNVRLRLENPQPWELGWLTLVLRDLAEGWLRVGFGAAKGFGQVEVEEMDVVRGELVPGKAPAGDTVFSITEWSQDDAALLDKQKAWVGAFHKRLDETAHYRDDLPLPADTYFGNVADLYKVEEVQ